MQQLPILGSLVQTEKSLVPQILDNILGYEGSGNVALMLDRRDTEFDGYDLSFFYKTETSGARPLEFDIESNTVILPPQLFTDKGKIYIGLLGTKQVGDKLVKITTSPARLRVRETVDPNDLDQLPTESEWMEVVNQMVNQLSKDLDTRITKLEQEGTGGGTKDHSKLINREMENAHPLSAITGLVSALANKLEKSKLGEAITQALAQAKQSGEFNGTDGQDGQDGVDGISPTMNVTQAENGTTFTVTDTNGQTTATIKNGTDGKDGKTPVKGVDYFTVQDKQEIETATANKLKPSIPTKTSQLQNDSNFLTEHQNISHLATKQEIPSKLPTPNVLSFTGAVSGTFDGSSPLEVNIPQGGGSGGSSWKVIANVEVQEPITVFEHDLHGESVIQVSLVDTMNDAKCTARLSLKNESGYLEFYPLNLDVSEFKPKAYFLVFGSTQHKVSMQGTGQSAVYIGSNKSIELSQTMYDRWTDSPVTGIKLQFTIPLKVGTKIIVEGM